MLNYSILQAIAQAAGSPERVEGCVHCGENHPFDMPEDLLSAALDGKVVVFAGAGVSTESRVVDQSTFAERIAVELDYTEQAYKRELPSFPQLMSEYEERFGRRQLLQRIRERLDYIKSFPEIWSLATRFHHTIATAYFLNEIITTNWDTYFEDIAAATPIVVPEDYAFWDVAGRKVFKLHGSIDNLGTIVATKSDYERCYRRLRTGVIGASLKHLLATKRALFIGYSFGDPDLNAILGYLRRELSDLLPRSYLVTPHNYDRIDFPPERVIKTDGSYFIRKLKDAAVARRAMRPDRVLARTIELSGMVADAHHKVSGIRVRRFPAVIHTLAYQDGIQHALDRIVALLPSGYYSDPHNPHNVLRTYASVERGAIRMRSYWDAAYVRGYRVGLITLDAGEDIARAMPLYFVWGSKRYLRSFKEFERELSRAGNLHKAAVAQATRLVREHGEDLVAHHAAYLDVDGYKRANARARGQVGRGRALGWNWSLAEVDFSVFR